MDDDAVGPPETDDVLGAGWVARTLPLRPDALSRRGAPDPVATLVHRRPDAAPDTATDLAPPRPRTAVLYLHGFVDYFFHPHVAAALAEDGYDLWALDLRDYGRSIRPGRPANEITDLATYTEEIDTAVRLLRGTHERVVVLAHSTGGWSRRCGRTRAGASGSSTRSC
ncbi:alpha/beta hydrolase [Cellulomonas sp. JZ18]|uniref:alpha/beta hydrolase n=1 Tax=Cellulomonas sp. JZ18 TaxID=2654191 RepID=UPI00351BBE10